MIPMSVLADTKDNLSSGGSLAELAEDDEMEENHGTITTNNGTITSNGTLDDRQGTVTTNNGTIWENYGTVTVNEIGDYLNSIARNYGTVTTNNAVVDFNFGTVQNQGLGVVNYNAGEVTGGLIDTMNDGNATGATISSSMTGGTAKDCTIKGLRDFWDPIEGKLIDLGMQGGEATNCTIENMIGGTAIDCTIEKMTGGTAKDCTIKGLRGYYDPNEGKLIDLGMQGGEATNCTILNMIGGTATNCTIERMIGGTARGANTVIEDYQGGEVSKLVPLTNIKKDGKTVTEDDVKRVDPIPAEIPVTSGGGGLENPYYLFLMEAMPQLQDATQGATVEVKMDDWNTLTLWFMKEIAARGDLTIHMTYRYEGKTYDVTFPAGMTLMIDENIPYYGPLKLADMAMRGGGICNITQ